MSPVRRFALYLVLTSCVASVFGGCAKWRSPTWLGGDGEVIHVSAGTDRAKAQRLTIQGSNALRAKPVSGIADVDKAAAKFTAAIAADPSFGPAHNNLGLLHYEQGNLYQAVIAFEEAMRWLPDDGSVVYNLALALEAAGQVPEALELYFRAVELEPTNPIFLGNLVRLRLRMGDRGPDVESQLSDLVLIETRPTWRAWADRKLALELNPLLDRGPANPEFDTALGGDATPFDLQSRIIDLTPEAFDSPAPTLESLPPPRAVER